MHENHFSNALISHIVVENLLQKDHVRRVLRRLSSYISVNDFRFVICCMHWRWEGLAIRIRLL